jgi:hypothetical protein
VLGFLHEQPEILFLAAWVEKITPLGYLDWISGYRRVRFGSGRYVRMELVRPHFLV